MGVRKHFSMIQYCKGNNCNKVGHYYPTNIGVVTYQVLQLLAQLFVTLRNGVEKSSAAT